MYLFSHRFFDDLTNFLYIIFYIFLAIVGIIILIVIGMVIYNYVDKEKSKKEFINYKKNIPNKYRKLSAKAKQDIYDQLVRYRKLKKEVDMYNKYRNTSVYSREEIVKMTDDFRECRKIMTASGDENRQHILLMIAENGSFGGLRVNEITKMSHLSHPAVPHHLQVLKKAGILAIRKEGTKNYYYFDTKCESFDKLIEMFEHAKTIAREANTDD